MRNQFGESQSQDCLASWEQAELQEISLGFTCAPKEEGNGSVMEFLVWPHITLCVSALRWERWCSGDRSSLEQSCFYEKRSHTLSCPLLLIYQCSPFRVRDVAVSAEKKLKQRIEYYLKGMLRLLSSQFLSFTFGAHVSAWSEKRTDWGIWNPRCAQCPWLAGRRVNLRG